MSCINLCNLNVFTEMQVYVSCGLAIPKKSVNISQQKGVHLIVSVINQSWVPVS